MVLPSKETIVVPVLNRVIDKYQKDIVMLWNDNVGDNIEHGPELKAPENNTAIKVKNTWETTYNRGRRQEEPTAAAETLPDEGIAPPGLHQLQDLVELKQDML